MRADKGYHLSVGYHSGRTMTEPRILREILNCYGEPNHFRSTAELAITVLPIDVRTTGRVASLA